MLARLRTDDARAVGLLALALALLTAISWRRWGVPSFDVGLDLTVADQIANDGVVPYDDVRYFYGPAGIYSLALAFKLFGTSLTVAFAVGYVQTLAILGSFYVLARSWLAPVGACLATGLLMAIAFSGTFFDYVLPHTGAGTLGCLFLILQVLAITRGREVLAGGAAGLLMLTRVEFMAFAVVVAAGAVLGHLRESGPRRAARSAVAMAVPALVISLAVYIPLAAAAGLDRMVFENLVPVDFARFAGSNLQSGWAPFTPSSFVATAARGALVGALAWGLIASVVGVREGRGARALWPLAAALGGLALAAAAWKVLGIFPSAREDVTDEVKRFLIASSWLPIPAIGVLGWAAVRAWRDKPAPGIGWPADLALLAGGAAAGLRGYNEFTSDSYAPYWAALPVLVAVIVAERIGVRWPKGRVAARAVPAVAAAALVLHAYVGLYRDDTTRVNTPRGTYMWYPDGGPAVERTTRYIDDRLEGREPIVVLPDDPGIHFLSGHPSALYESTFLPGTLDTEADERDAIEVLERRRPRLVVVGAQRMENYGFPEIGVDYNRLLFDYVRREYRPRERFGDVSDPTSDNEPARAFTIWERRP